MSRTEGPSFPATPMLAPAEWLYRLIVRTRRQAFDRGWLPSHAVDAHVISVGNLVLGGTGKTPLVIALAEALVAAGRRVAVLHRGYRAQREHGINVVPPGAGALADPELVGDEAVLIARRVPGAVVISGADRVVTAQRAVADHGVDTILLDDGFQHRRLRRDLDLVVLRARDPFGNGRLLPRGPLREPLAALVAAHGLILNMDGDRLAPPLPEWLIARREVARLHLRPSAVIEIASGAELPLASLRGVRVCLVSGVGRPAAVARTLGQLGALVVDQVTLRDHHRFTAVEIDALGRRSRCTGTQLVTTEKDAVKWRAPPAGALALRVRATLRPLVTGSG